MQKFLLKKLITFHQSHGDYMSEKKNEIFGTVQPHLANIDDERQANWLLSAYSEPCWVVTDTNHVERTALIDFRYTLANGRILVESERLYRTVKEFAWGFYPDLTDCLVKCDF